MTGYTTLPAETIAAYEVITIVDGESGHRPVMAELDLTRGADTDGVTTVATDDRHPPGGPE